MVAILPIKAYRIEYLCSSLMLEYGPLMVMCFHSIYTWSLLSMKVTSRRLPPCTKQGGAAIGAGAAASVMRPLELCCFGYGTLLQHCIANVQATGRETDMQE